MKLTKLAAKFSIKAKSTYNKALDQTTSTCTSLFSSFTPLDNYTNNNKYNSSDSYYVSSNERKKSNVDEETTYDVERIKFEEMMSNNVSNSSNTSRYKKIYKSFKSTMRRNSSTSNSSSSTSSMNNSSKLTTLSSTSPQYLLNSEHNLYSDDIVDNKLTTNGLNVFQNGYGYNDTNENYFYDHSVYPCVKTVSTNNSTLSKTSKKVNF